MAPAPSKLKKKYEGTRMQIYVSKMIDAVSGEKTQGDIAAALGYEKPNMISMIKNGDSAVPIERVPDLANVLHVSPAHLFRLVIEAIWPPGKQAAIQEIFGTIVTPNEVQWLNEFRKYTEDEDMKMTSEHKKKIKEVFAKK